MAALWIVSGPSGVPTSAAARTVAVGQTAVIGMSGDFAGALGGGGWPVGRDTSYPWRVETRVQAIESDRPEAHRDDEVNRKAGEERRAGLLPDHG